MIADCVAIVVAGGESQRMGCDKATLTFGERTLLQHVTGIVQPMFPQTLVSVRQPRMDITLPQIADAYPNAGPLAGLCAGLVRAKELGLPWIFLIATDMPFVQPALIEYLAQQRAAAQAVVPIVHGHPQPLAAFYSVNALQTIQAILDGGGKRSLRGALERLPVSYVNEADLLAADPGLRSFFDLDTPQDFAAAREYHS